MKNFTIKMTLVFVLTMGALVGINKPAKAGIPVFDGVGLVQHILNVIQNIAQRVQMITDYQTQLQQFQTQLQNTIGPSLYIWDQANSTINGLLQQVDTVRGFRTQFGSINNYLQKFKDVDYYRQRPCLSVGGCTNDEMKAFVTDMEEQKRLSAEVKKKANDALVKSIDEQQDALERDADTLRDLQANAQTSQGQMEAIQHANQLASAQANQLLQLRALFLAQQSAISTEKQTNADKAALAQAQKEKLRKSTYQQSPVVNW